MYFLHVNEEYYKNLLSRPRINWMSAIKWLWSIYAWKYSIRRNTPTHPSSILCHGLLKYIALLLLLKCELFAHGYCFIKILWSLSGYQVAPGGACLKSLWKLPHAERGQDMQISHPESSQQHHLQHYWVQIPWPSFVAAFEHALQHFRRR